MKNGNRVVWRNDNSQESTAGQIRARHSQEKGRQRMTELFSDRTRFQFISQYTCMTCMFKLASTVDRSCMFVCKQQRIIFAAVATTCPSCFVPSLFFLSFVHPASRSLAFFFLRSVNVRMRQRVCQRTDLTEKEGNREGGIVPVN